LKENLEGLPELSDRDVQQGYDWESEIATYFGGACRREEDRYYTEIVANTVRELRLGV